MMLEVRCCCDAGKLLGWLPDVREGNRRVYRLSGGEVLQFEICDIHTPADPEGHDAYKSKDYPIELLRQIPQFVEATPYEAAIGKNQPLDVNPRRAISARRPTAGRTPDQPIPSSFGVVGTDPGGKPDWSGSGGDRRGLGTRGVRK